MLKGWISIHRKIQDNSIWNDKPFNRGAAWIDLLLLANHEDKKMLFNGNVVEVKRGEKLTSLRKLSERWGWSITKVKKFLNLLSDEKMISYKSDSKKTVYNIVNYEVYQDSENIKSNTEITLKENKNKTKKNQKEINNNDNNDNNDNKNNNVVGVEQSELDLDEPQLAQLIKIYENCGFGLITPYSANMLRDYMNEYSFAWVKEALEIAMKNGVRTLSYVGGILKRKQTGGNSKSGYRKKETYYKPKEQEEVDTSIVDSFIKKIKGEGVTNDKTKQV